MKAIVKIFSVIAMLLIGIGIQVLLVFNRPSSSSAAVFADSILTALGFAPIDFRKKDVSSNWLNWHLR